MPFRPLIAFRDRLLEPSIKMVNYFIVYLEDFLRIIYLLRSLFLGVAVGVPPRLLRVGVPPMVCLRLAPLPGVLSLSWVWSTERFLGYLFSEDFLATDLGLLTSMLGVVTGVESISPTPS